LITVLWIVFIISIISLTLASTVRAEVASQMDAFDSERAFFIAKGAGEAMFSIFVQSQNVPENGPILKDANGDYVFSLETGEARVRFESEAGRIDLNSASDKLLAYMFDSLGVAVELRNRLVDSILDWRDPDDIPHLYGAEINDYPQTPGRRLPRNAPFETVDELLQVKNMTPELFNGSFVVNSATGQYTRIPGVRELVTVDSRSERIEINEAPIDVLRALPQITPELAQLIVAQRSTKAFSSTDDLTKRISGLAGSPAMEYVTVGTPIPTGLVSRATVRNSGASRSVRLSFKREERMQTVSLEPFLYKKVIDIKFGHWQF
jgi:general secretion pathway protein K